MRIIAKRSVAMLLLLVMAFSSFPVLAFATEAEDGAEPTVTDVQECGKPCFKS